ESQPGAPRNSSKRARSSGVSNSPRKALSGSGSRNALRLGLAELRKMRSICRAKMALHRADVAARQVPDRGVVLMPEFVDLAEAQRARHPDLHQPAHRVPHRVHARLRSARPAALLLE